MLEQVERQREKSERLRARLGIERVELVRKFSSCEAGKAQVHILMGAQNPRTPSCERRFGFFSSYLLLSSLELSDTKVYDP